ncbi:MAG: hypothetical protein WCM93_02825 [Bacteroidota bacterium]
METKQFGGVIMYAMLGSIVLLVIIMLTVHEKELPVLFLGLTIPLLALVTLLFYNLTVEVTREKVAFRFGIGLVRRSYSICDIDTCTPVTNRLWYGWGIHFIGNTTVYNVSGIQAVELTFKGRKRRVRIGTDEPEKLSRYINEMIGKRAM